jgi:hypothetical protein
VRHSHKTGKTFSAGRKIRTSWRDDVGQTWTVQDMFESGMYGNPSILATTKGILNFAKREGFKPTMSIREASSTAKQLRALNEEAYGGQ